MVGWATSACGGNGCSSAELKCEEEPTSSCRDESCYVWMACCSRIAEKGHREFAGATTFREYGIGESLYLVDKVSIATPFHLV